MLRPSKKLLFAIEAVLNIAYHACGEPVQSLEIAHRQGILRHYLEQMLQYLVRRDVLIRFIDHVAAHLAYEHRRSRLVKPFTVSDLWKYRKTILNGYLHQNLYVELFDLYGGDL